MKCIYRYFDVFEKLHDSGFLSGDVFLKKMMDNLINGKGFLPRGIEFQAIAFFISNYTLIKVAKVMYSIATDKTFVSLLTTYVRQHIDNFEMEELRDFVKLRHTAKDMDIATIMNYLVECNEFPREYVKELIKDAFKTENYSKDQMAILLKHVKG